MPPVWFFSDLLEGNSGTWLCASGNRHQLENVLCLWQMLAHCWFSNISMCSFHISQKVVRKCKATGQLGWWSSNNNKPLRFVLAHQWQNGVEFGLMAHFHLNVNLWTHAHGWTGVEWRGCSEFARLHLHDDDDKSEVRKLTGWMKWIWARTEREGGREWLGEVTMGSGVGD